MRRDSAAGCLGFVLAACFFFVGFGMSFGDVSPGWLPVAFLVASLTCLVLGVYFHRRSWLMWTILALVTASLAAYLLPNL
jgi:hypothetical protein